MRIDEAFAQLNIIQDFIPVSNGNRPGDRLRATAITIHNTDNTSPGADAAAHARYVKGPDAVKRQVSWHFTADDKAVHQSLPTNEVGWHAGRGNASSIGIEICMHPGMDEAKAYARAALLTAVMARQEGIDLNAPDTLVQHHHWTGKHCPRVLRDRPGGWRKFVEAARAFFNGLTVARSARITPEPEEAAVAPVLSVAPAPKPVPVADPVPFAEAAAGEVLYWPVVTRVPEAMTISYETVQGDQIGRPGRRFLAGRSNGARQHVGIDLFAAEGNEVVACAAGRIVAFYPFYTRSNGEVTYTLFVAHAGFVANYGEVKASAPAEYGWKIGDSVTAGQRIARVSGTAMLHFETYGPGIRKNLRWLVGGPRPEALRNPTRLLLALALTGVRLAPGGVAMPAPSPSILAGAPGQGWPDPGVGDWRSRFGGREWRYDARGVYTREAGSERLWRSNGEPVTCREIFRLYGPNILAAATKHRVNPALIMMTIATETAFAKAQKFTGPRTFRWEAHVDNEDVTPAFKGAYSAGPMQGLSTTVRELITRHGAAFGLGYQPFVVAPAINPKPATAPTSHPLYEADANIDLGAGEIRMRWSKTSDDPILVAAAYNRGGLYETDANAWRLSSQGDHLDRAAAWFGDSCQVLVENGVW